MSICNICSQKKTEMHRKDNIYNIAWICENKKCVMFCDRHEIITWSAKQREYTDEDVKTVRKLRRAGNSYRQISLQTGIPKSTLSGWL